MVGSSEVRKYLRILYLKSRITFLSRLNLIEQDLARRCLARLFLFENGPQRKANKTISYLFHAKF